MMVGGLCVVGAGCSSGGTALSCKDLDSPTWRIDPAWRKHLEFELFSVPTSGPHLVHQILVLSY